ncbi:MAG: hypothetical protein JXB07_17525 [Anaerolineae bacterium]|nr:hypothetical protein [Anaerolineae bacterium]
MRNGYFLRRWPSVQNSAIGISDTGGVACEPTLTICYPSLFSRNEGDERHKALIGSKNTFGRFNAGVHGFVTNGGVRDTDEIILQQIPFWSRYIGQTMVQTRLQFDAKDIPVAVGGVQVRPGDVVVADGDGVIVVPREIAEDVAKWAQKEHENDKKTRRKHYEAAGRIGARAAQRLRAERPLLRRAGCQESGKPGGCLLTDAAALPVLKPP